MRPLKLMLEGFRSHHERTEITFEGRTLVAVVGPTGAGKSSVLDGISYALYGRTPREQRSVRKLICSNSEEARVNFRFEVDRRVFEITRVMRRKSGPSPHLLVEVDSGEQTSGEAAVSRRVEELLGLDFGAFCASVLLAQGEFARFLQAAPTKRAQILKGVFRLEQIDALREAAQVRVDALTGDLRVIEGERRGIPVDLDELLADAKRRHKELRTRAEDLAAALPREQAFERRRARAQDELDRAVEALGDVEAAEADLLPPDKLADLAGQESSIAALVGEAERVLATSERERAAALEALSALERELGREADLYDVRAQAGALAGLIERVDALTADRKALDEDIGGLRDLLATEERAHAEGVALLDEARRARAGVERGHAAHVLRSNLRRGDPCPVCERVVSKVPAGHAPPELSEVEASEKVALARESEAASAVVRARTSLEVAMERGRALAGQEATAREELDERRATIEQRLGGVEDPLAEINGRLERLADARERVDLAQREREGAREKLERNRGLKEDFAKIRRRVAGSLISVAGRIGVDAPDVDAPADVLADHAREARRALTRRAERLRAERDAAERDANEVTGRLVELHRALSLGDGESIAAAMSEARSAADLANAQRRDYDAKRKLAKEVDNGRRGSSHAARCTTSSTGTVLLRASSPSCWRSGRGSCWSSPPSACMP